MADEEKTPETEETPAEAPETVADEVASAAERGRGDERSEAGAASEEGAGASVAEGDRGDERSEAGTTAEAAPAEPQEVVPPKERRARKRAAKAPTAAGPKTPEERDAERRAARAHKAKVRRTYRQRVKAKEAEQRRSQPTPEPDHAPEHGPGRAKVRQGIVVSDKADKTIVVRVDVTRRHRRYGKIMRTSSKIHVHDERNDAGTGDTVRVVECRPMSRTKRWRLTDVLEKAK
jgi:small subunit ribosomal protein S17